ncbi:methylmalonyl-CoA mutase family protein, partial [Rhodococcus sp. NPDC058514]|uniref:methylmalonyl-CoA mutase family protein n=1 Tax=Rhodococcus sp. NPDC058514 TaxID=3346532 RepID=UPI00365AACC5
MTTREDSASGATGNRVRHVIGSFADVPLTDPDFPAPQAPTAEQVAAHVAVAAAANNYTAEQVVWSTPEGIDVKPVYTQADRDAAEAQGYPIDSFPGAAPFLRGPYPTMYVNLSLIEIRRSRRLMTWRSR